MKARVLEWNSRDGWQALAPEEEDWQLCLYFGDRHDLEANREAIRSLCDQLENASVFGCSSAGEICGDNVRTSGITAIVMRFDDSVIRFATREDCTPKSSHETGRALVGELVHPELRGVIVLSEGVSILGSDLVDGLSEHLPAGVALSGGLAGDGDRFEKTLVGIGDDLRSGRVIAIGLYGEKLDILCGSAGGWQAFGPFRKITRAHENVLIELDGEPALAVYRRYLGERAAELPGAALLFPLAVYTQSNLADGIVRTILNIDDEAQTMTFAGRIPEGALARLMHAGPERLIDGAQRAAERTGIGEVKPDAALLVSCVGRRLALKHRTDDEIEAVLAHIGHDVPTVGFYSYGEIAPGADGRCGNLHNQTMTVTLIRERVDR